MMSWASIFGALAVAYVSTWVLVFRLSGDSHPLFGLKSFIAELLVLVGSQGRGVEKMGIEIAERRQSVERETSNDSFYFHGYDTNSAPGSEEYTFLRLGFRHGGRVEVWMFFKSSDGHMRWYFNENHRITKGDANTLAAGPLKFRVNEAMKHWTVEFNGSCDAARIGDTETRKGVHFELKFQWRAQTGIFDFDVDLHPRPLALSLAKHQWSISYFREFRREHQNHYEQGGALVGTYAIEDDDRRELHMQGIRDHSWGSRDWSYLRRWVTMFVALKDGRFFHLTLVDHPLSREVLLGYISDPVAGFVRVMDATPLRTFEALEESENTNLPPMRSNFRVRLERKVSGLKQDNDGWLECDWEVDLRPTLDAGGQARFYEQQARYVIGGVRGGGILEFAYNPTMRPDGWKAPPLHEMAP